MDRDLAWHVIRAAMSCGGQLEDLLAPIRKNCDDAEYDSYARAIARVIAAIHLELTDKIISCYPDFEAEIERKIEKYDRVI